MQVGMHDTRGCRREGRGATQSADPALLTSRMHQRPLVYMIGIHRTRQPDSFAARRCDTMQFLRLLHFLAVLYSLEGE